MIGFTELSKAAGAQGLKPASLVGLDGMAEAMPLHFSVPEARFCCGA